MKQSDIDTIKEMIVQNCPIPEQPVAYAMLNTALELMNKFERITLAFEKIAASHEPQ